MELIAVMSDFEEKERAFFRRRMGPAFWLTQPSEKEPEMAKHPICEIDGCPKFVVRDHKCTRHYKASLAEAAPGGPRPPVASPAEPHDPVAGKAVAQGIWIQFIDEDSELYLQVLSLAKASRREPAQEVLFRLERDVKRTVD